jgi:MinD-like ATPase involved in chromosome partitioning or flagellar assembly
MSRQLETLRAFSEGRPRARRQTQHAIIVAGGKGGTGVTTVSALLALGAARSDHDVLLVDAAPSGSSTADLFAATANGERTTDQDDLLRPIGPRLTLADRPAGDALTTTERRTALRRAASHYENHDIVVVDAGAAAESIAAAIGAGAGTLVAVTSADRLSAAATYALVKFVTERYPGLAVSVLVNRCDPADARIVFDRIAAGVTEFLGRTVTPAGSIPEDETLRAAIEAGLTPAFTDGPALESGRLLAERLIRRPAGPSPQLHLI